MLQYFVIYSSSSPSENINEEKVESLFQNLTQLDPILTEQIIESVIMNTPVPEEAKYLHDIVIKLDDKEFALLEQKFSDKNKKDQEEIKSLQDQIQEAKTLK